MKYADIAEKIKPFVKRNKLKLYRAFRLTNGEAVILNTDGELLFTTLNGAIEELINRDSPDILKKVITVIEFTFDVKVIRDMELGTNHFNEETGSIGIILDNIPIGNMAITDYQVNELEYEEDPSTQIKKLTVIELEKQ